MNWREICPSILRVACAVLVAGTFLAWSMSATAQPQPAEAPANDYLINDSHFHLTNYIQEGTDIREFLGIMGTKVGRVALFGLPLQQEWSYENSGDFAPTYYLQSDAPLYYYSSDVDVPFAKFGSEPVYLSQMRAMLKRHPKTTIIWAHLGLGRVVRPVKDQAAIVEAMLTDPAFNHVYFDISWDEVAKYLGTAPDSTRLVADIINRYPDRFLFGTDEVAPESQEKYLRIYDQYRPLWDLLDKKASEKVRKGNYERIFDQGRRRVRAWEQVNVKYPRD